MSTNVLRFPVSQSPRTDSASERSGSARSEDANQIDPLEGDSFPKSLFFDSVEVFSDPEIAQGEYAPLHDWRSVGRLCAGALAADEAVCRREGRHLRIAVSPADFVELFCAFLDDRTPGDRAPRSPGRAQWPGGWAPHRARPHQTHRGQTANGKEQD